MVHGQLTNNTINLFGSLDKKLHTVARSMLAFTDSDKAVEAWRCRLFDSLWGIKTDTRLYSEILQHYKDTENPARLANRVHDQRSIDELILEGEQEIRKSCKWRITRCCTGSPKEPAPTSRSALNDKEFRA
jgi:hypothetical protein